MSSASQNHSEHFAHCLQVLGGVTAASRRLNIDERALRRFANGERPIGEPLMQDTAQALRALINEAEAAAAIITAALGKGSVEP
ncbi:MAG: hypothetical protein RLZZ136_1374 [Pseudomonadota bacterium]